MISHHALFGLWCGLGYAGLVWGYTEYDDLTIEYAVMFAILSLVGIPIVIGVWEFRTKFLQRAWNTVLIPRRKK